MIDVYCMLILKIMWRPVECELVRECLLTQTVYNIQQLKKQNKYLKMFYCNNTIVYWCYCTMTLWIHQTVNKHFLGLSFLCGVSTYPHPPLGQTLRLGGRYLLLLSLPHNGLYPKNIYKNSLILCTSCTSVVQQRNTNYPSKLW